MRKTADIYSVGTLRGLLRDGGVRLLKYGLRTPEFSQDTPFSAVNGFCREFASSYEKWLNGELFPRLCAEYRANENPRKRFLDCCTEITLDFSITYAQPESGVLSMYWDFIRRKRGTTESIVRKSHTWNTVDNYLYTARDFLRGRSAKKAGYNFYLKPEALILYENRLEKSNTGEAVCGDCSSFIQETSFCIKN